MNPLLWKRLNELKKNKARMIAFFIFPIAYLALLHVFALDIAAIIAFFPLTVILVSTIIHFSVEDLVSSEIILATNITIKKIWIFNSVFVSVVGYVYSSILLGIYIPVFSVLSSTPPDIPLTSYLLWILSVFSAFATISISTIHYADNSRVKQLIASVFAVLSLTSPVPVIFFGNNLTSQIWILFVWVATILVLALAAFLVIARANKEKLLINTQTLARLYEDKFIDE